MTWLIISSCIPNSVIFLEYHILIRYRAKPVIVCLQLLERRIKAVHRGEESERFKKLNIYFMSEESSDDDEMIVHRPRWRSESEDY